MQQCVHCGLVGLAKYERHVGAEGTGVVARMACAVLQAGEIRTALGSGLLQLGLQPKASLGLYAING